MSSLSAFLLWAVYMLAVCIFLANRYHTPVEGYSE